jgi:hypothetical protein
MDQTELKTMLEQLVGQSAPLEFGPLHFLIFDKNNSALGYSQLNELLLLLGFDRISFEFFQFLVDGNTDYQPASAFTSAEQLSAGVDRFRRLAVLLYGNIKFAFKSLSRDPELLVSMLETTVPLEDDFFTSRHGRVLPLEQIDSHDAYLTGYIVERELRDRLGADPTDQEARTLEARRQTIVGLATNNNLAYLASDHLDVYVATSMRERHEFAAIGQLVKDIFGHAALSGLKLRWFDPTQAYCHLRIDKGLCEALMLRRAACTIYLAQETDTFGKDSELAATLAQGKPVVAFVPDASEEYVDQYLAGIRAAHVGKSEVNLLLAQLELFEPHAAWGDSDVRAWCETPTKVETDRLRNRLGIRMKSHYDRRALTLRESHPLGIQVNLGTGVANGVLVVRNVGDCATLVRNIVTRKLDLHLEKEVGHTVLRERISGCVFRVVTDDVMLTNTFWNFYLNSAD